MIKQICELCNKEYEWDGIKMHAYNGKKYGYNAKKYCSNECMICAKTNKRKQTCLEKYGVENVSQVKEIKIKKKKSFKEKYGVEYALQNQLFKNKMKQTCMKKYGVENVSKSNIIQEKIRSANLKRLGVEYPGQSKIVQEKMKQTCMKKYGVENVSKSIEIKRKKKESYIKKYNTEHYTKSNEYKLLWNNKEWVNVLLNKQYETKRKNKSFNVSRKEEQIYQLLKEKFNNIERNYKSKKYPWNCDFYIPELDLYIEYQGHWTHGAEPYNSSNIGHQSILEKWQNKNTKFYENAINVWTIRDVEKRTYAKENKLNWLEFFSIDDFNIWYFQDISEPDWNELYKICTNIEFPGTNKWPANHPIWNCYVANKMSPKEAWKTPEMLHKAIHNLRYIWKKGLSENIYIKYIRKWKKNIKSNNTEAARVILDRFTVAKIAPKVTAISEASIIKILKESKKDFSNGIYCPMAGFGGIVRAAKKLNISIEAYDINKDLNNWYGWTYRNVLEQTIITDKIVVVCPPFGENTERWPGTPNNMYYSFEEWCRLIKKYIKASDYVFIGPEKKSKNKCGLFGKSIGVQVYPNFV